MLLNFPIDVVGDRFLSLFLVKLFMTDKHFVLLFEYDINLPIKANLSGNWDLVKTVESAEMLA